MKTTLVSLVMYFYMFVCIALLVFSLAYIQMDRIGKKRSAGQMKKWLHEIRFEGTKVQDGTPVSARHLGRMERKLKKLQELTSYHEAVLSAKEHMGAEYVQRYLDACLSALQALALHYAGRPAMERAYFAHVLAVYHPDRQHGGGQIAEILLRYFDDSTVFCRENTLQALYATGKAGAVVQAFGILNDSGWYHYPRLLSDGMAAFPGDQAGLGWKLWKKCGGWSESIQVAVVQFITALPGDEFAECFLEALENQNTYLETRFALTRYFQRHAVPQARPVLLAMLSPDKIDSGGLAITAAGALVKYPGEDSRKALMNALSSRNWYVRKNSAASLAAMGATQADVEELRNKGDRYAAEMLAYMLETGRAADNPAASRKSA